MMNTVVEFLSTPVDWAGGLAALGLLLVWGLTFCTLSGGSWSCLRRCRPRSDHPFITLMVTGVPVIAAVFLLWPNAPGKALVLVLCLILLGGELFLRLRSVKPDHQVDLSAEETLYTSRLYQPHHYTFFEPRPDIRSAAGLAHNRWGFRDHRPLEPDERAIRLVFLGGPVVYGVTTPANAGLFTQLLEQRLNSVHRDALGGRHFEVINAGMANATTAELLLRQIFAVSEVQPALVAIQAGICDTWPRICGERQYGDNRQMRKRYGHGRWLQPGRSVADSLALGVIWRSALLGHGLGNRVPAEPLLEMTNRNNTGLAERLTRNPPSYFERNLRYMLALNRAMGAHSLLIGDPIPVSGRPNGVYQRAVPEHAAVMARLAETGQAPFLDLGTALPLTDDLRDGDKYLNAKGQRRLADVLFDFLMQTRLVDALLSDRMGQALPSSILGPAR